MPSTILSRPRMPDAVPTRQAPASVTPPPAVAPLASPDAARAIRRTFYSQHLVAAQYFADGARAAERRGIAEADRRLLRRYRELVASAVLSAAAYLEVNVNELYLELLEGAMDEGRPSKGRMARRLVRAWRTHRQAPTLEKYQLMLGIWDADTFHPRRPPYSDVERLLRWRDVLVSHHRGSLLPAEQVGLVRHDAGDESPRVTGAVGAPTGRLRLDAACASWAVRSVTAFSEEFCRRMHLPSRQLDEPGPRRRKAQR